MKDRPNIEGLWKSTRKTLFVVAFGIIFYEILENLTAVRSALSGFVSIITPVFIGIAIAFIANMPMNFLEAKVFRRWKTCGLKRGVCLVLAILFVFAIITTLVLVVGPQLVESVKTWRQTSASMPPALRYGLPNFGKASTLTPISRQS